MESLFQPIGLPTAAGEGTEHWHPTELARGPWSPEALHGGPVAALLTRALERLDAPAPMRLTRVTVELLRPVPVAPLWLSAAVIRPGRKVGMLEASLGRADDGQLVAIARAQRVRTAAVDFPDGVSEDEIAPPLPDAPQPIDRTYVAYHNAAVEHRFLRGVFGEPGPSFDWVRLRVPVVPDEEPSGWQRAAAAADFANGISSVVAWDGSTVFINPDLTLTLWREPIGDWIGLDAITRTSQDGIGASDTVVWDRTGCVGHSNQSLLLDRL
jgi:hypothetical protein